MITGIVGAAAGALGGLFGGVSRNKMLRKQMAMVREQQSANQNWYDRRYNEDATQRADAQAALTHMFDELRNRRQGAAGGAAVMGGTTEGVAAEKEANARALADATRDIVVAGEQRKDDIERQYLAKNDAYNEQLRQLEGQRKNTLDMISDTVGGAAAGFAKGMGA